MAACMRGSAALIGVLGLIFVAGCSEETATGGGTHRSSSCIPPALRIFGPRPALPKELSIQLKATILSRFAILRRSALPSDEPPTAKPAGGKLDRELSKDYELSSYYPAYVRQLTRLPDGRRYFVIPAFGRPEAVPPAHWLSAGVRRELVEQQHQRLVEPVYCIIEVGGGGNTSLPGCAPFAAIDEGGRVFQPSYFTGEPTVELVPDGVASVRITYRATAPIVVPVSENALLFTPPPPTLRLKADLKRLEHRLEDSHLTKTQRRSITMRWDKTVAETDPTKIEWLANIGGLVRAISAPTATSNSVTSVGNLRAPIEG
ncbi:MAG TPA: hypothetical protein VES65_07090 [Solirubrobacteraceae bacterium]|nr:hypothetical protein [Solirubrobacteraceae bacterium]